MTSLRIPFAILMLAFAPLAWGQQPVLTADVQQQMSAEQLARWDATGPTKLLTRAEVEAAGAPVVYAGLRSRYPQQKADAREAAQKADKNHVEQTALRGKKAA